MEATIIFKNSQRITAEQNGNCFIMNEAPVFPADLSEVRVVNEEGERVRHIKFGKGTVISIVKSGRDFEVTVDFDKVGRKKMFASFAKLKPIRE